VSSGRALCVGVRSEESCLVWCVLSVFEEPHLEVLDPLGLSNHEKNEVEVNLISTSRCDTVFKLTNIAPITTK